jgi:aminopeptidase N
MTLSTTVPQDWVTISNSKEVRYEHAQNEGHKVLEKYDIEWFLPFYENQNSVACYEFEQTPRISTYLYAICAGPYKVFEDDDPSSTP